MGAKERNKGARFERLIANELKAIWPEANRNYAQRRGGTCEGADVEGTPYAIECKKGKTFSWDRAYEQAKEVGDGRPALVVGCRDRGEILVMMSLETFRRLHDDSDSSETEPE